MYAREPRFITLNSQINPRVGPASYVIEEPRDCAELVVPFLTLESHDTQDLAFKEAVALPSPTAYTVKYRKHRIKGGISLRYTSARTSLKKDCVPSPVRYDPHHRIRYLRKPIVEKPYKGPPPRYGSVHGVSVPPSKFLGYIVKDDVIVNKFIADAPNYQLTSKFIPFPGEINQTSLKYKGIFWGKNEAARFPKKPERTPGPGDYELGEPPLHPLKQWDEEVRAYKRATCRQPRMSEIVTNQNELLDLPGPPAYYIDYSSYYAPKSHNKLGSLSKAERFVYREDPTLPGPATYNVKNPCSCTSKGKKTAAFLTRDVRMRSNRCRFSTPGPSDYTVDQGTIRDFVKKKEASVYAAFSAPFNSTVGRSSDPPDDPSPGAPDYDIKDGPPKKLFYGVTRRSPLASTEPRIMDTSKRGISPSRYELSGAYQRMFNKRSHNRKKLPFMSTGTRFEGIEGKKPGPADYDPWAPELTIKELPGKKAEVEPYRKYLPPPPNFKRKPKVDKCGPEMAMNREKKKTDGSLLKQRNSALPKKFLKCFLRYPMLDR